MSQPTFRSLKVGIPRGSGRLLGERPWARLKKIVVLIFLGFVIWLLYSQSREIVWQEVATAIRNYELWRLGVAMTLVAFTYTCFVSYDLLARRHVGHQLPAHRVSMIAYVAFAMNLSLGAIVGGMSFRYLLYSRAGLSLRAITHVVAFSVLTNWLGYVLVLGFVLSVVGIVMPPGWRIPEQVGPFLGAGCLLLVTVYLGLCRYSRQREVRLRRLRLSLPSFKMALAQLLGGALNWLAVASLLWILLPGGTPHLEVLSVHLVSGVAAVLTHIPAGLGVQEAVFIAFFGDRLATPKIIAALLVYRVLYYVIPLLLAIPVFLVLQRRPVANRSAK